MYLYFKIDFRKNYIKTVLFKMLLTFIKSFDTSIIFRKTRMIRKKFYIIDCEAPVCTTFQKIL
jgi:hypothetical protein